MTENTLLFIGDYEFDHPECDWCNLESPTSLFDYHSLCETLLSFSKYFSFQLPKLRLSYHFHPPVEGSTRSIVA